MAALVALAFSLSTWERWRALRRPQELAWAVAFALFCAAATALAWGAATGFDATNFRLFYLFGAIVNVPFLAVGTVYLHAPRRLADRAAGVVALLAAFAAGVVLTSPLTAPIPEHELVRGSEVFGPLPRVLAAFGSGAGAVVVFGGAAWSAWRYRRGRMFWANLLIAAGTLILSSSGLLNSVVGEMEGFAITLAAGIVVLFAGFLIATAAEPVRPSLRAVAMPSAAPAEAASRRARAATPRRR